MLIIWKLCPITQVLFSYRTVCICICVFIYIDIYKHIWTRIKDAIFVMEQRIHLISCFMKNRRKVYNLKQCILLNNENVRIIRCLLF